MACDDQGLEYMVDKLITTVRTGKKRRVYLFSGPLDHSACVTAKFARAMLNQAIASTRTQSYAMPKAASAVRTRVPLPPRNDNKGATGVILTIIATNLR